MEFKGFPENLIEVIHGYKIIERINGRIGDSILKLMNTNQEILYLKIGDMSGSGKELSVEQEVLGWLSSKNLQVPKALFYKIENETAYLLMSNVEGRKAYDVIDYFNVKEIIKIAAEAVKAVHNIDFTSIPNKLKKCLAHELEEIKRLVENDMIDIEAFKKANNDHSPKFIMEYLLDRKNLFEENVFTHGDYCLPNLLVHNKNQYGYVDWAQAGIGDIYRDLAPMVKSINRNFGHGYSELFFESYGISKENINNEKIKYYDLMDQFTYYKTKI